jgi:glycine cleavage system H protein
MHPSQANFWRFSRESDLNYLSTGLSCHSYLLILIKQEMTHMDFPKNFKFTKDHEWVDVQGTTGTIGVTAYAVEQLGDIVHIDLPESGKTYKAGESFGTIESTKTVSDLYMPVAGKVTAVNAAVKKAPESLQTDAHKNGWLVKIEMSNPGDVSALLDAKGYEAFIKE